jgi:condensin complex subunit 1
MIAAFIPFVLKVVQNVHRNKRHSKRDNFQNTLLEKISIITLCKFMCISEDFCKAHLDTLFSLLKSDSIDYSVKNNIIISLGDLLHRFPNVVQQYHKQIYSNLHDGNPIVRKITLLVLTHLILNDMIKSKVSLRHIPRLLTD